MGSAASILFWIDNSSPTDTKLISYQQTSATSGTFADLIYFKALGDGGTVSWMLQDRVVFAYPTDAYARMRII